MYPIGQKLKSFIESSKRIFMVSKKPTRSEYMTMLKVTGVGIVIIAIIGYIITFLFFIFILPPGA